MRQWIPWRADEPRSLARYVLPDVVGEYLQLPGPSGESPVQRLGAVYAAVAGAGIRYAHEPPSDQPDSQEIRSPAEVLWAPRHATCLDLAITFAGACLKAGLHPLILLIARSQGVSGRHALVGVWLQEPPDQIHDELQSGTGVWAIQPGWLPGLVRRMPDDAGQPLVVLDPVGVSIALPSSPARGVHVGFERAVANGADRLFDTRWSWQAGVDLAQAWREQETYQPAARPPVNPLRAPYLDPDDVRGPLRLLRADYGLVPFQPRDELTILRHWCSQAASNQQTGLAIIDGTGGSGKTRLALELAQRLHDQGWYAGLLLHSIEGTSWSQSVEWLAGVVSPILVIVDYADARAEDTKALMRALTSRTGGAVVVLTARTVEGEWLREIEGSLQRDGQVLRQRRFDLPPEHPDSRAIFRRAAAAFATQRYSRTHSQDEGANATIAVPERWTTLDYVLLGWLAASGGAQVPSTRQELYEEVLDHEERYWSDVYRSLTGNKTSPLVLRRAATCLTLLASTPERAGQALRAVPELASADEWRENVRRTFAECFNAGPHETLALRPDPIADYLAVKVLGSDPGLLDQYLAGLDNGHLVFALSNLNRAGSTSPEAVTTLLADWLHRHPARWQALLPVAAAQAGSALTALEAIASEEPTVVALPDLAQAIPFGHAVLTRLGLAVETRRLQHLRAISTADPADLAELLDHVSRRQSDAGDQEGALASNTEAASLYRTLAKTSPAYLPDLAVSLNNLSVLQGNAGDQEGAMTSITEAVRIRRTLAETSPAYLPDLATSLNNLSITQSEARDREGALASITEAVQIQRPLAETSPAYLPGLARSLSNLSNCQGAAGDRDGALNSIIEAVGHYRALANADPGVYLPDLAKVLNNLSSCQSGAGNQEGAMASITEAMSHYRVLARTSPAAFLPGLAATLNNLSRRQSEAGDQEGALNSATEAVQIQRTLAETSPGYLPDLARSLNYLSRWQSEALDLDGALASVTEAVQIQRTLAETSPAYLPELAGSLSNLSNCQGAAGDREGALASVTEAVQIQRTLAETSPAYLPELAGSLNNLSTLQGAAGDREGALASVTEAVQIERTLAETSPGYLPDLAMGLNNLSIRQGDSGDHAGALASIIEGVGHYRVLAKTSLAYLPDLAASLCNLSIGQVEAGDRDAALASLSEAVGHYRALAQTSPAYLPGLARALNNLSSRQSEAGDRDEALASVTEAVQIRRALAETSPASLPDLAASLNSLSNQQGAAGDREGALASITEAVQIRRALAETSPASLPDLAVVLNNLANWQGAAGDSEGALASITEAVSHYRALAKTSPAAYLDNLAWSLSNLSSWQGTAGDSQGALASITEAVSYYRTLAKTSPAAYLPNLAALLSNLANWQRAAGDSEGALASITEAVSYYRTLAKTSPAAYLPNLAALLSNLANWQRAAGDSEGALASITEAVSHYRTLAKTSPAAYLPNLAALLSNLANWQRAAGDSEGALASITEAVSHYRTLAKTSPAAYLPSLATLLTNLTRLLGHSLTTGSDPWAQVIADFDNPLPRAELRASYALALAADGNRDAAIDQLANAQAEARSGDAVALGRARQAIRRAATALGADDPRIPRWATQSISDDHADLIILWAAKHGWPATDAFLTEHAQALQNDNFRAALSVSADLFPDNPKLASLAALVADLDGHGLDAVLASGRAAHAAGELIRTWIETPTWEESANFLQEHRAELTTPRIRQLLADNRDEAIVRQHLAILDLTDTLPQDKVYQIVTDTEAATERALDLVESGNLDQLALTLDAAPGTLTQGLTGAFLQAVIALANRNYDVARQIAALIAEHGTLSQREAFAIRLRAFADRRLAGHHAPVDDLVAVLNPDADPLKDPTVPQAHLARNRQKTIYVGDMRLELESDFDRLEFRTHTSSPVQECDCIQTRAVVLTSAHAKAQAIRRMLQASPVPSDASLTVSELAASLGHAIRKFDRALVANVDDFLVLTGKIVRALRTGDVFRDALALAEELAAQLDAFERLLNDFTDSDLERFDLHGINLTGVRWSNRTKWPVGWIDQIKQASVETEPGIFAIHIDDD